MSEGDEKLIGLGQYGVISAWVLPGMRCLVELPRWMVFCDVIWSSWGSNKIKSCWGRGHKKKISEYFFSPEKASFGFSPKETPSLFTSSPQFVSGMSWLAILEKVKNHEKMSTL